MIGIDDLAEIEAAIGAAESAINIAKTVYDWSKGAQEQASAAASQTSGASNDDIKSVVDQIITAVLAGNNFNATQWQEFTLGPGDLYNWRQDVQQQANEAHGVANQVLGGLADMITNIGHYSLDEAGLAEFDEDVNSGAVVGSGIVVTWQPNPFIYPQFRLNPHFFVIKDPPSTTVLDARVVLDALNGLYLSKVLK